MPVEVDAGLATLSDQLILATVLLYVFAMIAYACDLNPPAPGGPDGVFTEGTDLGSRQADEWTYNVTGDVPPAGCVRPQAVRLTIIARTTVGDDNLSGLATNAKPAAEDGAAGARDNFRHRVLTTIVSPRNR